MRILAVDIGTGTQDILLFDSRIEPENCFKMVMPSPTAILAGKVRRATAARQGIVLSGVTMGGGPVGWALDDHLKRGLPVAATADAARTIDDDLAQVEATGVAIVGDDEVERLAATYAHLVLKDVDLNAIALALHAFAIDADYDGLAVAVLDHGSAPAGVSDRVFRFDHICAVLTRAAGTSDQLLAFAYTPRDLPPYLTRMQAVLRSIGPVSTPVVLLDTGAAAALGALQDPHVARSEEVILLNLGNMHTLATHIVRGRIAGVFEHHTGFLTTATLNAYIQQLVAGTLRNETVFVDNGHGCYIVEPASTLPRSLNPLLSVTGPRRALAIGSEMRPYFAAPHGDMMIAGCYGLARACAARVPEWQQEIMEALRPRFDPNC